jgi:polysaccharide deacetylase family protein (PEP-CTERM system associated)
VSIPPDVVNVMTVDVEDYYHVSAFDDVVPRSDWGSMESRVDQNTRRLLDLFDEFSVKATFFVLGWIGEREPALVAEIDRRGHEVASHGYGHRLVYQQSKAAFREDVRKARQILQQASGQAVVGYRAPSYSITNESRWALDVLTEEGYRYDSSIFPIHHDRYGVPGAPRHRHVIPCEAGAIVELPPATANVAGVNLPAAGGGYFRLLPYAWTEWAIRRINGRERQPAVFYIHPWELDPEQPRLPARGLNRFRHYRNLDKTEMRLRRLLGRVRFGTCGNELLDAQVAADVSSAVSVPGGFAS